MESSLVPLKAPASLSTTGTRFAQSQRVGSKRPCVRVVQLMNLEKFFVLPTSSFVSSHKGNDVAFPKKFESRHLRLCSLLPAGVQGGHGARPHQCPRDRPGCRVSVGPSGGITVPATVPPARRSTSTTKTNPSPSVSPDTRRTSSDRV